MIYSKAVLISFFICLSSSGVSAQTITSKVVDKKTGEPIPYATVQISENQGIITNEEGSFSLNLDNSLSEIDSIYISSMGYEKVGIAAQKTADSIIYIEPKAIELKSVFISNKNLSVDEIINHVKERVPQNYSADLSKKRLFFRQSEYNNINKMNIEFKKSTIDELNKKFIDSILTIIPRKSAYYTEILSNYYGNHDKAKLDIIKAAELYDKNNLGDMDALSQRMEEIFKANVKPDSYLKIKSGIFGTKVQVDSILEQNEEASATKEDLEKKDSKNPFIDYRKSTLKGLFSKLFFQEDSRLNFIDKAGRYDFELLDYTYINDQTAYVIKFSPKRKEDFKGTLYINTEDFAVMRMDYENVKLLKNFRLLGLTYKITRYRGKTIFVKGADNKYHLKFLEKTVGTAFGVDRPLKVIEKNKHVPGRNKQNELSLNIDVVNTNTNKYEVVVFNAKPITETDFKNSTENKAIKPQYLSRYDPEFWKGYNIIEPNAAIRQFTVTPEAE